MESKRNDISQPEDDVNPQALLGVLENSQAAAVSESLWPLNPLWHGPLLALAMWGILAFSWDQTSPTGLLGLAVVPITLYFTGFQYMRQRKTRGARPTGAMVAKLLVMFAVVCVVTISILIGWGQTVYRFGDPAPGPVAIVVGLLISSVVTTMGISITNMLSRHWLGSAG